MNSQTLTYETSQLHISLPERIKKRLESLASPPSSVVVLPSSSSSEPAVLISTATTGTTSIEPVNEREKASTSVFSLPKVFSVQKFYASPSTPMDEGLQAVWTRQIRDRLNQTLKIAIPTGICLQEFMHMGRRADALKPTLVVNCGDAHIKRQVEKAFKSQSWLQEILKSKGITFVALVVKISPSAKGPMTSSTHTIPDQDESYALELMPGISTSCGLGLLLRSTTGRSQLSCTLGGLICVDGAIVGLTAGHPFQASDYHTPSDPFPAADHSDDGTPSEASSEPFVFNGDNDEPNDTSTLGSSGAWVTLEDKLCGHIIAVRQDLPWAYMLAIEPMFDDIKMVLGTDDVRLPTNAEVQLAASYPGTQHLKHHLQETIDFITRFPISDKTPLISESVATKSRDWPAEDPSINEKSATANGSPRTSTNGTSVSATVIGDPVSEPRTRAHSIERANRYRQEVVSSQDVAPLPLTLSEPRGDGTIHPGDDHKVHHTPRTRRDIYRSMPPSRRFIYMPLIVWHLFETFILRTEYKRRRRKIRFLSLPVVGFITFSVRPLAANPGQGFGHRLLTWLKTIWYNRRLHFLVLLAPVAAFGNFLLNILYFILCFPFICWVLHRHHGVLEDVDVLRRQVQRSFEMLGNLPRQYNDKQLIWVDPALAVMADLPEIERKRSSLSAPDLERGIAR
ncbi:MAG: hypothetical protein Q9226_003785 [Calogaya cf. arnoldii]